jgi:hypothetical protein
MATGTVYLDVDDEITSAAARIRGSEATKVALVVPHGSRIATSRMNFRLLSREAIVNNRLLSIVATDPATRALAASAGLPVFASVAEWDTAAVAASGGSSTDGGTAVAPPPAVAPAPVPETPPAADDSTTSPAKPATGRRSRKKAAPPVSDDTQVIALPAPAAAVVAPAPALPPVAAASRPTLPPITAKPAARVPMIKSLSLPRIGAPAAAVAAAVLLALVVVGVGAYVFLPSAQIVVTPRQEGIGPIALVVRADPDVDAPDATLNVVPALLVDVPVEASESFTTAGRRVEENPATGTVTFENYNFLSSNPIPAGSIVSTEGGIQFATQRAITLPEATFVLPSVVPSRTNVAVTAVKPGTSGNVPANAIRVVPRGEDPELTKVNNPEATSGGTHEEFPQISQAEVDAALAALQTKVGEAFTAAVDDGAGAPPNATVFAETAVLGETTPTVDPATLVGQEVESFELGLTATGTVIAVDATPVKQIAETRLLANVGGDHRLVKGSIDIRQGDPTVVGGEVSFPVTAEAMRVSLLDPDELLALVKGRSIDEARSILSQFGEVEITAWPDWVSTIPGIDSRVTIEIVGQDPDEDTSASPSASVRPSRSSRPSPTPQPIDEGSPPATSPSGPASPAPSTAP